MKNILFVHSSSELYGSDRSLLNIVKNLDKEKYRVYVILPCQGPLVENMKQIPGVTVEIYELAVLRRKNLSFRGGIQYLADLNGSVRFLKRYMKCHEIDIVDTNTAVVFPGAIAAKQMRVKSVWHIREIIKNDFENRVISGMMNRYADVIVANSKATGQALRVNKGKVRVIYNAVEEKTVTCKPQRDCLAVGMAGRINRWKGQKLFVDAAEMVHQSLPDVVFKIAGEAYTGEENLKQELEAYIKSKGLSQTVFLLGQVDDMMSFYNNIDVFVLPSIQPEPFGLVIIEAMEYGLPVIATNHGGPTEIIEEGVDGYLVDPKNAEEMAMRMMELLVDEKKRLEMGRKGTEKKRALFSVASMVKKIENVFEEVLN